MYTLGKSQRNSITPDAVSGSDFKFASRLANGKHNKYLLLTVEALYTITAPGTAIKNRGSVLAMSPLMGCDEDDNNVIAADARLMGVASDAIRTVPGTALRLTSTANGAYKLREQVKISFENPFAARSRETQFLEHELTSNFRAFLQASFDPTRIMLGGTATVTGLTVRVLQVYDNEETKLPMFRTAFEQIVLPVTAPLDGVDIPLQKGDFVRAITIQQDTTGMGEVSDIIQRISLIGDVREYIGGKSGPVNYQDLAQSMEFEAGGNVYASAGGCYLRVNFQHEGRLSKIMSPKQDTNLVLRVYATPSQVANAGNSNIRILVEKLVRDGSVGANGRRVVAPALEIAA